MIENLSCLKKKMSRLINLQAFKPTSPFYTNHVDDIVNFTGVSLIASNPLDCINRGPKPGDSILELLKNHTGTYPSIPKFGRVSDDAPQCMG